MVQFNKLNMNDFDQFTKSQAFQISTRNYECIQFFE